MNIFKLIIILIVTITTSHMAYAQKNKKVDKEFRNIAYAEIKDEKLVLTNQDTPPLCPAQYLRAYQGYNSFRDFVITKELCWLIEEKTKNVIIFDPNAKFFKTTKISERSFTRIPTPEEKLAQEYSTNSNSGHAKTTQIAPTPMMINGELALCHYIGSILHCD